MKPRIAVRAAWRKGHSRSEFDAVPVRLRIERANPDNPETEGQSIFQAVLIAARRYLPDAAIFYPDGVVPTPGITGWDVPQSLPLPAHHLDDEVEELSLSARV